MLKPASPSGRIVRRDNGCYEVTDRYGSRVVRPNRTASGFTRQRTDPGLDLVALVVRGTFDTIGNFRFMMRMRTDMVCPCCKQRRPGLVLSPRGRARLDALRARAAQHA